ncbi:MAG: hypothetical protein GX316_11115 [Firmicutes bacterium]|nr:hypothetical protein [Bacillota bacterium]
MSEEKGVMYELLNVDADTASEERLRALVKHLQGQMRDVYVYWVGNWGKGNQVRSTRNGQFVSKKEVIDYLNG